MAEPTIKMIAVSNVFSRLMHFKNAGDVEVGHCHTYDHATLISSGAVRYEVLDGPNGNTVVFKDVYAPNFVFVDKNKYHRLTALEPNTVCACIHALRTVDGDLVDSDCLLEPFAGNPKMVNELVVEKTNVELKNFCVN
jgi:hypothetical protein